MDGLELVRAALRRRLRRRPSEDDARSWSKIPLDEGEQPLSQVADWGPAEDWADWA